MGCLTQGRNRTNCGTGTTGGVKWVYLADRETIDIVATQATQAADGSYPSVTMVAPTDYFYKFVGKRNTTNVVEDLTTVDGNTSGTLTVTVVFDNSSQADKQIHDELKNCNCGLVAIWCDNSGNTKISSLEETEELLLATTNRDTGTAKADPNQMTLTFTAEISELSDEYTGGEASIPVAP